MSGSAIASTRARKAEVIEEVAELLGKSNLVFSIPSSNINVNDVVKLRKGLPDGCTARVVKNKLMRIACKGTDYEQLAEVTTGENFWMFVEGEENLAAPIEFIADFAKNIPKEQVCFVCGGTAFCRLFFYVLFACGGSFVMFRRREQIQPTTCREVAVVD